MMVNSTTSLWPKPGRMVFLKGIIPQGGPYFSDRLGQEELGNDPSSWDPAFVSPPQKKKSHWEDTGSWQSRVVEYWKMGICGTSHIKLNHPRRIIRAERVWMGQLHFLTPEYIQPHLNTPGNWKGTVRRTGWGKHHVNQQAWVSTRGTLDETTGVLAIESWLFSLHVLRWPKKQNKPEQGFRLTRTSI